MKSVEETGKPALEERRNLRLTVHGIGRRKEKEKPELRLIAPDASERLR